MYSFGKFVMLDVYDGTIVFLIHADIQTAEQWGVDVSQTTQAR